MNTVEEIIAEPEIEPPSASPDRAIYAAIAAFLYEENKDRVVETAIALPSVMDPWKMLARRESVG
ncbi:MAG TPA: hypothetical protein VJR29_09885 [bacterium]|nr:hypothetical protein [bacterium]